MNTECVKQRPRWHRRARHAHAHSLRVRLMTLFLLLALVMAGTFLLGMQYALSIGWRDAARPLVVDYVDRLAFDIGSPPSPERATALIQRLPLSIRISGPAVNWRSHPDAPDLERGRTPGRRWNADEPRFFERTTADGHQIVFGVDVKAWHDRPRFIGWATLAALLLMTALAYARVRRLLRPLDDIRAGALRFGAGDFDQPIAVRCPQKPDELGELAVTINTMGADIRQMLDAKRGLLLAISHELRSPLTRARLNTELLPETPGVQPGRDALLRDLALMRDLVTGLLESERLASRHAALQLEPTDLGNLVREVVHEMSASNPAAQRVTVSVPAGLPPQALDRTRMRLLVRNLLDNALRHSAESSQPPEVTVSAQGQGLMLAVRDYGPGVEGAALPHLAEPFYRPDSARTRATGGVGLGLYLCRLVAQAHGGSLTVCNAQPGLEVRVVLPG
ncbi:HAMP domain-containing sensor histidine kinase [Polaromonas sp.]|uniref:HAMP domain-containing sensor histidine kinase n=1 Tax=Polaromonas sp. TaxID=1869339 RepID=UPI003BB58B4F